MVNFHQAMFQANLLYGVEMLPQDFEEFGLIAWNLIGNKNVRLYRYCTKIECPDYTVELPCNCDIIEAVTYASEDWKYVTNYSPNGDYTSKFVENYIEGRKMYEDPLYMSGKYAKFERVGDTLYFDKNYGTVYILYKGVILDDEGLPMLSEKESLAIATFVAYRKKYKEGLMTNNANILQTAQLMLQDWLKYCDAARVPEYLNQNEMNDILDAKTNWNRKRHNFSYKPV